MIVERFKTSENQKEETYSIEKQQLKQRIEKGIKFTM